MAACPQALDRRRWTDRLPVLPLSVESAALWTALLLSAFYNQSFWLALGEQVDLAQPQGWRLAAACAVLLWALHAVLLLLLLARWNARILLAGVIVVSSVAAYYMDRYQVLLDPPMLRNILHTEPKEAGEYLTAGLLWQLSWQAGLPLLLLWRVRIRPRSWAVSLGRRALAMGLLCALIVGVGLLSFQPLSLLMREHKTMRYLVVPGNWIVSTARVLGADLGRSARPHIAVGADAQLVSPQARPRLVILVVGETVRNSNWGLSGYPRQTTPELAREADLVNFPQVTACGTSTEVSLPCMFSVYGRRAYDEDLIARSDSLLQVLERAGVSTLWRDNQTGCKGVCADLPFESFLNQSVPGMCADGRCLDEVLLHDLQARIDAVAGTQLVVLHQLGNHGPSYYSRYPSSFERFRPACRTAQLGDCSHEELINAYDNAVLYTDHFLASTIELLRQQTDRDTALIYVSDHGESLGEHGLYLHGIPYALAPQDQTQVPMLVWLSEGMQRTSGISSSCLREQHARALSHDYLFSSVLSLLDVRTRVYEPNWDLFAACKRAASSQGLIADREPGSDEAGGS